ncbi:MAG: glycosyltransferase [Candidatus Didemnitutus sp.]|nr:glycosyltransferase [Candidatus Didemnitutus sp.]
MQVSFVIPLYNCLAYTRECFRTLQATLPGGLEHEIIFVDDGSTDGTRQWLASLGAPCRAILNESNLGFASACNRGAAEATGRFLVFLNNDLVLLPGWFEPLLAAAHRTKRVGVVGNIQLRVDNGSIDHSGIVVLSNGKLAHERSQLLPFLQRRAVRAVPAVTAACCLVERELFLDSGSFDPQFVNGGEDVDLCFRLARAGQRNVVSTLSVVRHHVSAARGPTGIKDERNSRLLAQRWTEEIIQHGSFTWARQQVEHHLARPWTADGRRAVAALPFALRWSSKPPSAARRVLVSALHRETVRWQQLFDLPPGAPRAPRHSELYWEERFYRDDSDVVSVWLRDRATVNLPVGFPGRSFVVSGFVMPAPANYPEAERSIGFRLVINGEQRVEFADLPLGHFNLGTDAPLVLPDQATRVDIELIGVSWGNFLAWLGRMTQHVPLPNKWRSRLVRARRQALNRRLRFEQVVCDDEVIFEFKHNPALNRRLRHPICATGVNLIGWFRAAVGIGESVRCMAKACDAASLPAALIDLRLNCLNGNADDTFASRLQEKPDQPINVFHIDPPVSDQIDHHHGPELRRDRYNIAYWAWELPVFPQHWVRQLAYFDEVWCPSEFVRASIAATTDLPVHVMPHAIDFALPSDDGHQRFGLSRERFHFLFTYDLNSYQERKNPLAVIAAYRRAFPDEQGVGLVIKTQNPARNPAAHAELVTALRGLQHVTLLDETLSRPDVFLLQQSCDCFVSLHRAEGFGLAVAEAMYLGKPVIATDWSATAEYLDATNGLPVPWELMELRETHGPYEAGQKWANPSIEHAAAAMQRLINEPELAGRLGAAAAKTVRERFSPAVIGQRYRQRFAVLFPEPRRN